MSTKKTAVEPTKNNGIKPPSSVQPTTTAPVPTTASSPSAADVDWEEEAISNMLPGTAQGEPSAKVMAASISSSKDTKTPQSTLDSLKKI